MGGGRSVVLFYPRPSRKRPRPSAFLQFLVLILANSALPAGGHSTTEALTSRSLRSSPIGSLVLPKTCRSWPYGSPRETPCRALVPSPSLEFSKLANPYRSSDARKGR